MPEVVARTIKEIRAGGPSDAGQHLILQMLDEYDEEISIAIPNALLFRLVGKIATAENWKDGKENQVFRLTGFQFGRDEPDTGKTTLHMISSDAVFPFWLSPDCVDGLCKELSRQQRQWVKRITGMIGLLDWRN